MSVLGLGWLNCHTFDANRVTTAFFSPIEPFQPTTLSRLTWLAEATKHYESGPASSLMLGFLARGRQKWRKAISCINEYTMKIGRKTKDTCINRYVVDTAYCDLEKSR
jgi:hypothetical protein